MKDTAESDKQLTVTVLLKMYETRYILAKQAEDQRAQMSNFLITIAAVMFAFVSQQGFSRKTILISLLMILLGFFGLFMSNKYAQHYLKNDKVARSIRDNIDQLFPEVKLRETEHKALDDIEARNPFFSKVPTLHLWAALHTAICLVGGLCILLALFQ